MNDMSVPFDSDKLKQNKKTQLTLFTSFIEMNKYHW